MDDIKAVCLVSMLAGIIGALIPSGKMKSAFSAFCSVVMIFYIVSPLSGINAEGLRGFSLKNEESEEMLLSDIKTAEVILSEQMLEDALENNIRKSGFDLKLNVSCEKKDGEIKIKSITVSGCENEEDRGIVKEILLKNFNEIEIVFEGGRQ